MYMCPIRGNTLDIMYMCLIGDETYLLVMGNTCDKMYSLLKDNKQVDASYKHVC